MKTPTLTRLYDKLTVWERIPLLVAAEARSDEVERRRLFDSSPMRTLRLPEHLTAEMVLHIFALAYVGEQLNVVGTYFFALSQADDAADPEITNWLFTADLSAYLFVVKADAWRRFCSSMGIDSSTLTAANHQGWFLTFCEQNMPANAMSADVLRARWPQMSREIPRLVSAEDLLAQWRDDLQAMTRYAPPAPVSEA